MKKYLVITDGGDGDITHYVAETLEDANREFDQAAKDLGYTAMCGIFEVDFEAETITQVRYS